MADIAFADIRLEVSAEKAHSALGQIGLNSLDVRTHPFKVGKCAKSVPIALSHSLNMREREHCMNLQAGELRSSYFIPELHQ